MCVRVVEFGLLWMFVVYECGLYVYVFDFVCVLCVCVRVDVVVV